MRGRTPTPQDGGESLQTSLRACVEIGIYLTFPRIFSMPVSSSCSLYVFIFFSLLWLDVGAGAALPIGEGGVATQVARVGTSSGGGGGGYYLGGSMVGCFC